MKLQLLVISFISLLVLACSFQKNTSAKNPYSSKSQALKDYGFCRCLTLGFEKDTLQASDASIAVIAELSDYSIPLKKYRKVDSLAKLTIENLEPLQHADYGGKKAIFLKCIELYKSKELKKLSGK